MIKIITFRIYINVEITFGHLINRVRKEVLATYTIFSLQR